jgi:hypothetical protein
MSCEKTSWPVYIILLLRNPEGENAGFHFVVQVGDTHEMAILNEKTIG